MRRSLNKAIWTLLLLTLSSSVIAVPADAAIAGTAAIIAWRGDGDPDGPADAGRLPDQHDRPFYTTPGARRYPWPVGFYNRSNRYWADWRRSCSEARNLTVFQVPTIDCWYTWEHWHHDNHLQYRVHIPGNDQMHWYNLCSGMYDNIKRNCGKSADCNNVMPGCWCDKDIDKRVNANHGFEFFFPMRPPWEGGEDDVSCITAAIKEAMCGLPLTFVRGKCYYKAGSQIHEYEGKMEAKDT